METREDLLQRKRMCYDGWFYSVQRIDLLIISISGAGVYIILETLKQSFDNPIANILILKIAGVLFVLSIITNFASQFTGKKANAFDMCCCEEKLLAFGKSKAKKLQYMETIDRLDKDSSRYTRYTDILDLASIIIMTLGLLLVIAFFLSTF